MCFQCVETSSVTSNQRMRVQTRIAGRRAGQTQGTTEKKRTETVEFLLWRTSHFITCLLATPLPSHDSQIPHLQKKTRPARLICPNIKYLPKRRFWHPPESFFECTAAPFIRKVTLVRYILDIFRIKVETCYEVIFTWGAAESSSSSVYDGPDSQSQDGSHGDQHHNGTQSWTQPEHHCFGLVSLDWVRFESSASHWAQNDLVLWGEQTDITYHLKLLTNVLEICADCGSQV